MTYGYQLYEVDQDASISFPMTPFVEQILVYFPKLTVIKGLAVVVKCAIIAVFKFPIRTSLFGINLV